VCVKGREGGEGTLVGESSFLPHHIYIYIYKYQCIEARSCACVRKREGGRTIRTLVGIFIVPTIHIYIYIYVYIFNIQTLMMRGEELRVCASKEGREGRKRWSLLHHSEE